MICRQRKANRLKNYNYSSAGYYYITICTKDKQEYFGEINNNQMILNQYGEIVNHCWFKIPKRNNNVELDEFQIMPNHVHGIIVIKNILNSVGTIHELSLQNTCERNDWLQRRNMLLCKIIGFLKMNTSKYIHQSGLNSFRWQRSYYDHIIHNEYSLFKIKKYIKENPRNWEDDRNNIK